MRAIASLIAITAMAGALSCGGDSGGGGSDDADAAKEGMLEFFRASSEADAERACALVTDDALAEIAEFSESGESGDCEELFAGEPPMEPRPVPDEIVGPVGARDGFAIAVVRVGDLNGEREENLLWRLREDDGTWKLDSVLPIPTPEDLEGDAEPSEEAAAVLDEYSASLEAGDAERACDLLEPGARMELSVPTDSFSPGATYGPERKPVSEFTPCEWFAELEGPDFDEAPASFEDVLAVGDIALGYPGDSPPTVLVRTPDGWRVDPVALGVP
jgi:hypothetical protein